MLTDQLENNGAQQVIKKDNTYYVKISIERVEGDEYYFFLKQREGIREIPLDFSFKKSTGIYDIYEVTVPVPEHDRESQEKVVWDMYIFRKGEEGSNKKRIKVRNAFLFGQSILLPDQKMFYPYATKNDRLSFSYENVGLFVWCEDVKLGASELSLTGCIFDPEGSRKIVNAQLAAENNLDGSVVDFPVEILDGISFKAAFPIQAGGNKKVSYKFYLKVDCQRDGVTEAFSSKRMKWLQEGCEKKSVVIRSQDGKFKVNVFPSKGYKALTVEVSEYQFRKELVTGVKTKWVRFRRGDFVQNVYKRIFLFLGTMPKKKNLIIFESFHGKQYSDSPRAIYEYMRKNRMPYDMYWGADRRHIDSFEQLENVNYVRRFSLKWLLLMARAQYWVTNARLPLWLPKPRGTVYLQTWHGTPLKRLGVDIDEVRMPGTSTEKYKENFLFEASKWDYLVSPNAYSSKIFRRAFGFDKKMIESGYPRNDFLINENKPETVAEIKKSCNLPMDKKVILYAPTWRDNQFYTRGRYKFDLQMDLERMKEKFGNDYVIVLRLHYLVAENLDLTGYEGFVFDFSKHEDIRELYLIADLLITDYSSVFFDYANLKRPMIFFVYDIEDYRDNLRGFYFDFEQKAPGPLVKNTDELIAEIQKLDEEGFTPSANIEEFYARFCYLEDGRASERVVSEVFGARPPVR